MPAPIYLPRYRSPWESVVPQLATQFVMQKFAGKIRAEEREEEQRYKEEEQKKQLQIQGYENIGRDPGQESGAVKIGDEYFKPPQLKSRQVTINGRPYDVFEKGNTLQIKDAAKKVEAPFKKGQLIKVEHKGRKLSLEYTGDPNDRFMNYSGVRETGIETPIKSSGTTVKIENVIPLERSTKGGLEKDVSGGYDARAARARIKELTKPAYLTYGGRGLSLLQREGRKLGFKNPEQFSKEYGVWRKSVDRHMLLWRKEITGVAGGPEEFKRIEETTLNAKSDSYGIFMGALEEQQKMEDAMIKRRKALLEYGIVWENLTDSEKADLAKKFPYESFIDDDDDKSGGKPSLDDPMFYQ